MSLYPLLKSCFVAKDQFVAYVNVVFWPLAALALTLAVPVITPSAIDKYFRFVFYYALASNLIEIILFFAIGRLPALAYYGSISVRFGGFLDDPNGFPAIIYMLLGWAYYRFSGARRILAVGSLLLCILVSESFTALGFLLLIALAFFFQHMVRRPRPLWIISLVVGVLTAGVQFWKPLEFLISSLLEVKNGSVNDHLRQLSIASLTTPQDWLLGLESGAYQESWWVDSIVNFGLPWALLCLGIVMVLCIASFKAFRRARTTDEKAVLCAITMLCCFFLFGNANIPFIKTFPVNFLFFLFSMLVFFGKLEEPGQAARNQPPVTMRRWRLSLLRTMQASTLN